jgi:hypothetical protein
MQEVSGLALRGDVKSKWGQPSREIFAPARENFEPDRELLPAPPNCERNIVLAFLKAAWLQIPCWVHFTFMVSNPIYIYICALPLSKKAIEWELIPEVKPSIKNVNNLEVTKLQNHDYHRCYNFYDLPFEIVFTRGVHSLLYFAYTCVHDLYIGGTYLLWKKIIRWWYFTCKKHENSICDGILHVYFLQTLPTMNILDLICYRTWFYDLRQWSSWVSSSFQNDS